LVRLNKQKSSNLKSKAAALGLITKAAVFLLTVARKNLALTKSRNLAIYPQRKRCESIPKATLGK